MTVVVIASNSHEQKGEKVWGGVGGVWRNLREKEGERRRKNLQNAIAK